MGLIYTLDLIKAQQSPTKSCTSLPQQWHKPRGSKIKGVPILSIVIMKARRERKRSKLLDILHTWLCFAVRCVASLPVALCVYCVTFLAPPELLIITLFLPIIYTSCIVNSIAYLLYSNAHSYRSLVFILHFLAVCRVL